VCGLQTCYVYACTHAANMLCICVYACNAITGVCSVHAIAVLYDLTPEFALLTWHSVCFTESMHGQLSVYYTNKSALDGAAVCYCICYFLHVSYKT
jgi:hypothetical protein